ncbi:hypothetical protein JCM5296_004710 [Sporobolomyces johnsonii]
MSFARPLPSIACLDPLFLLQYTPVEEIGVGGSGTVLRVTRHCDGAVLAAKLICRNRVGSQGLIKTAHWGRHARGLDVCSDGMLVVPVEAYVLRRVSHRGVVGFVDLFADETFFYLIMEYHGATWRVASPEPHHILPPSPPITPPARHAHFPDSPSTSPLRLSPTSSAAPLPSFVAPSSPRASPRAPLMRRSSSDLFECIERHRHFDEGVARFVFRQIVATVCDLARIGIMHRDLKDENVCIDERLQVKLVDFGSCVIWDVSRPAPLQTGRFYGTGTFAAPEIFTHTPYDMFAAEVWSLGVLLSLLLTGQHPFASLQDARTGRIGVSKVPIAPLAADAIRRCLTVDVGARIRLEELLRHPWLVEARQQGCAAAAGATPFLPFSA